MSYPNIPSFPVSYQFNIYPTGSIDKYVSIVNDPLGASAIRDRSMGIIEHSMSGVAYYINNIENLFNTENVGLLSDTYEITSGYFKSIGYYEPGYPTSDTYPHGNTSEGVISGVQNIWASGTTFGNGATIDIDNLTFNSGVFSNCIFGDDSIRGYVFSSLILDDDASIQNIYSGYIVPGIPQEQTIPFNMNDTSGVFNNINLYAPTLNNELMAGINNGVLYTKTLLNCELGGLNCNGNIYIDGNTTLPLSILSPSGIHESIFDFDVHNHDGVNSAALNYGNFNSSNDIKKQVNIVMSSGNINTVKYTGNGIGLSTNWEELGAHVGDNAQKLITLGDSLVSMDISNMIEIGKDPTPVKTESNERYVGGLVSARLNNGDEIASYQFPSALDKEVSIFATYWPSDIILPSTLTNDGIANSSFDTVSNRKKNYKDEFHRINSKNYFTLYGEILSSDVIVIDEPTLPGYPVQGVWVPAGYFGGEPYYTHQTHPYYMYISAGDRWAIHSTTGTLPGSAWFSASDKFGEWVQNITGPPGSTTHGHKHSSAAFSLYEMDPISNTSSVVAATDLYLYASGIVFADQFTLKDNLVMPYRIPESGTMGVFVYNTIHRFETTASGGPTHEGMKWIPEDTFGVSGAINSASGRYITDHAYFDGTVYYLADTEIYRTFIDETNTVTMQNTGWSGDVSLCTYGGKLHTGKALEISYDKDGTQTIDNSLVSGLAEIVTTNNDDPWIYSPIVHEGWLYGLTSDIPFSTWIAEDFGEDKYAVNYNSPEGGKLIRRRVAETSLASNAASYTI